MGRPAVVEWDVRGVEDEAPPPLRMLTAHRHDLPGAAGTAAHGVCHVPFSTVHSVCCPDTWNDCVTHSTSQ